MNPHIENFWHKKFDQDEYFYGTEPNDYLRQHASYLPKNGCILSLGEGEGRNAVYLAQLGFQVTAVDAAQSGLDKVRRLAESKKVHVNTLLVDLQNYTLSPNTWDGIISIFCHLPPALRRQVHTQIPQALKPKGVFLLEAYRPLQLDYKTGGPNSVELLYTAAELAAELTPLHLEHIAEIERNIHEGQGHQGRSAVVQVRAQRQP